MAWDEEFSRRYNEWSADMTADVPFYVDLARTAEGPIVELAVGNGRVAIPVAKATGMRVIGIDSSPSMIDQARVNAIAAGVDLDLRLGDRCVFERVAGSLRPGGRFAWNVFAFDHHVAAGYDGNRIDKPVPHLVRYDVPDNRIDLQLEDGATSSLWWATKNEWLGLIDVAGLHLEALYGNFDRSPLTADSGEYVFVTRR